MPWRGASARSGCATARSAARMRASARRRGLSGGPCLEHLTEHQQRRLEIAARVHGRRRRLRSVGGGEAAALHRPRARLEQHAGAHEGLLHVARAVSFSSSGTRSAENVGAPPARDRRRRWRRARRRARSARYRQTAAQARSAVARGAHRFADRPLGRDDAAALRLTRLRPVAAAAGGHAHATASAHRGQASASVEPAPLPGTGARAMTTASPIGVLAGETSAPRQLRTCARLRRGTARPRIVGIDHQPRVRRPRP